MSDCVIWGIKVNYIHVYPSYCTPITALISRTTVFDAASFLAGLPRARSARGTEPRTHRIWSTSFHLVVTWLTERTYVRMYVPTYASTDCAGRVGETIKRKGGVSQVCLGKPISFILAIQNMVNWQLSNRIATDQYHIAISGAHVSTHQGDVSYLEAVRWPVVLLARNQCSISYFLGS